MTLQLTHAGTDSCAVSAQVKMFNLLETKVIRDLNPGDINKLISVGGMVTRASTVIPDLQCALMMACTAEHERLSSPPHRSSSGRRLASVLMQYDQILLHSSSSEQSQLGKLMEN